MHFRPQKHQLDKQLWWAAVEGNIERVAHLLKEGANPNNEKFMYLIIPRMYDGYTSLHMACVYNHPEVVKLLLANNAKHSVSNKANITPLQSACIYGNLSCVQLLVEAGCDTG